MILEISRIILASVGLLFWFGCSITNASVFIKWIINGKHGSNIPLIGGVVGAISFGIAPWNVLNYNWWIPFLFDMSYWACVIGVGRYLNSKFFGDDS